MPVSLNILSEIFKAQSKICPGALWDISISKTICIVFQNCNKRGVISFIPDWILNIEGQHMNLTARGVKLNLCEIRNEMNCQHKKQL